MQNTVCCAIFVKAFSGLNNPVITAQFTIFSYQTQILTPELLTSCSAAAVSRPAATDG